MDSQATHETPRLPQIIAHRGYKGRYPENTLCSVDAAVRAGSHALELDLHLTRDGVVVLSHDPTLKRCYGVKKKICECDWSYLSTLRTLQAPHAPMPRLLDILEYLREPGRESLWVLLDIKLANNPATIMQRIAGTIRSVPVSAGSPDWHERIVLGCWSSRYLPQRDRYLPKYAFALINAHLDYAREFLHLPRVSFNLNQKVLMGPLGRGLLKKAREANHPVYLWTVNAPNMMRWAIRNRVDGIITDDPVLLRRVYEEWEKEERANPNTSEPRPLTKSDRLTVGQRIQIMVFTILVVLSNRYFRWKFLPSVDHMRLEEPSG
ncbi:glycerophosphodiester phosphodiesterase [Aspergillus undulatus]|uniref:glycerophosphodiester phosphodiesterase n=1 Tax=Aspergillus undulatus TaxID=1810928 RepID=UPI003CCC966C